MARKILFASLGWIGVFTSILPAYAQQPLDAGALRQQIESTAGDRVPKAQPSLPATTPPAPQQAGEATVVARAFGFTGNTRIAGEELATVVAGYLGRPLRFADLQAAAAEVARHYRRQGWVVRTYLPRQDVSSGQITIHVVEAIFGQPEFEGTRPRAIELEWLRDRIHARLPAREPLNLDAVDRTLLLIDDLPGVRVSGRLEPGAGERETNVVLSVEDEPRLDGAASVDNGGSRATGEARILAHANFNSPFGIGELVQGQAMASQGAQFVRLAYQQPLGLSEWRIGGNVSLLRYRLVGSEFEALDAEGSSIAFGGEAIYPIVRSLPRNLFVALGAERKRFRNEVGGARTTDYGVDVLSASLSGNQFEGFGLGGSVRGQAAFAFGRVDLAGSPNEAADAATTRTAGRFFKLRWSGQNERSLGARDKLLISLSGQLSSKNLESSERFYLGGPNGVRAYPVGEGGGSDALLASTELQRQLAGGLSAAGFVDWGMVQVNRNNDFPGAPGANRYALAGLGAFFAWQGPRRLLAKLTWAHRIGDNPNAGATGKDHDGSLVKHRFWLSVQMPFEF